MRFLLALVFLALASPILAETRVAFVVGNSVYQHAAPLENPVADAQLISETLQGLGFEVEAHQNLTRSAMTQALSAFLDANADADVTLFYFAGHGMQFEEQNYLLGTDAALQTEFDIEAETVPLDRLVAMIEAKSRAALVFIDACRNNPLAEQFYRENFSETRAVMTRGLAPVGTVSEGAMLVFSASPGQVAYDGEGENSEFAASLARHLTAENVEVLTLMKRVIGDVKTATGEEQVPVVLNDLVTEIYLNLRSGGPGDAIALELEQAVFDAAMEIDTPRAWDVYLQRFPAGNLRDMALAERERLGAAEMAAASGVEVVPGAPVEVSREVMEQEEDRLGLTPRDIIAVQTALNTRGYDAGSPDGVMGQQTRNAVAEFQAATNLPITGIVTQGTAELLNIALTQTEAGSVPLAVASDARKYDPDALALIEDDERLIAAARTLEGKEFVYGFYDGRLYIGLLDWANPTWEPANATAELAGGHLVTLTTPEENRFVYDLVVGDDRFWDVSGDGEWIAGPMIGLYQLEGSREPDGGWVWVTGEPNGWINWLPGFPNNHGGDQRWGGFGYPALNQDGSEGSPLSGWDDYDYFGPAYIIEIE